MYRRCFTHDAAPYGHGIVPFQKDENTRTKARAERVAASATRCVDPCSMVQLLEKDKVLVNAHRLRPGAAPSGDFHECRPRASASQTRARPWHSGPRAGRRPRRCVPKYQLFLSAISRTCVPRAPCPSRFLRSRVYLLISHFAGAARGCGAPRSCAGTWGLPSRRGTAPSTGPSAAPTPARCAPRPARSAP